MRHGVLSVQTPLVPPTSAKGSGSPQTFPTPTTVGNENSKSMLKWPAHRRFATLASTLYGNNRGGGSGRVGNPRPSFEAEIGGLSLALREWMMGWPIGWTASEPLATDKFQEWWLWHGPSSAQEPKMRRKTNNTPTPFYQDDAVTIYCGDAFDIVPRLGVEWDHVITDPPYDDATHKGALSTKNNGTQNHSVIVDFASWDQWRLLDFMRLVVPKRWVIATMAFDHAFALKQNTPEELEWIRFGVWVKPNHAPQLSGDRPAHGWEAVAILHSYYGEGRRKRWNGGGHAATWVLPGVQRADYPTQKPVPLISSFVSRFTDPGDLILDPCCGSGTVGRVAKDLGRRAILIDVSEKACRIAADRMAQESLFRAGVKKPKQIAGFDFNDPEPEFEG